MTKQFLVGVTADSVFHETNFFQVQEKYVHAISQHAKQLPVIVPNLATRAAAKALAARLGGLFLTGSPSNVEPFRYGAAHLQEMPLDPKRDATVFALLEAAFELNLPVFCVCRGMQELNVFLGGTLQSEIHLSKTHYPHSKALTLPFEALYEVRQTVEILPNTFLYALAQEQENGATTAAPKQQGAKKNKAAPLRLLVNSIHTQAIKTLAPGLVKEAVSPYDQVIEAVRYPAKNFVLAVQWHPEHPEALQHPFNAALFEVFGRAVREYGASRFS